MPTLGPERRATYSPFLPVCPRTGRVLQAPVVGRDVDAGTITYEDDDGRRVETPGHRRPVQVAVEGRLGHAVGGAGRRL